MRIHKLTGENMLKISHEQEILRPGQIIQGKILKLYPDNKAQILLGGQTLIAQLEASLSIEGRYHFQVQSSDEMIHLKVLGEQLKSQAGLSVTNLMMQLGVKTTKHNTAFVQNIVNENIPFDRTQLKDALQILASSANKGQATQILTEMIARKLPITENVFQAIQAKNSGNISHQMSEMLQQLKSASINTELTVRLEQLAGAPLSERSAFIRQNVADNHGNKQQLFQVLKSMGMISQTVDFATWKSEWKQMESYVSQNAAQPGSNAQIKMPFQLDYSAAIKLMESLNANRQSILSQSQGLMDFWGNKVRQEISTGSVLTQEEFSAFKEQLTQRMVPLLPPEQGQFIKSLSNQPVQLERVLNMLDTLSAQQTFKQMNETIASIKLEKLFTSGGAPKEQFLQQLHHVLQYTGLSYENQIATKTLEENQSIKAMLLQMLQQSDGPLRERAGQLLHFINGMQLNAVNESVSFIQASLQIPAEKLGLNNDAELELESRKTADGKIDPDYCRIIFYLDLKNLKETIIDMNIQKRSVSITIFNDSPELKEKTQSIHPVLLQGLESLNYQLSAVHFKPLLEQAKANKTATSKPFQPSYQGVDYRI
ncbi:hypothetical protein [Oceanobacillus damuensis]|uniref:hypothetical protein n=1 Tax=Oceanobacillus damuensis TaxID=937928 RepID=UPI00082E6487|nr:hypothetical protein [Oceanobacillus damuensis]